MTTQIKYSAVSIMINKSKIMINKGKYPHDAIIVTASKQSILSNKILIIEGI